MQPLIASGIFPRILEEARLVAEMCRSAATSVDDAGLRNALIELAEAQSGWCDGFQSRCSEQLARAMITLQISALYR